MSDHPPVHIVAIDRGNTDEESLLNTAVSDSSDPVFVPTGIIPKATWPNRAAALKVQKKQQLLQRVRERLRWRSSLTALALVLTDLCRFLTWWYGSAAGWGPPVLHWCVGACDLGVLLQCLDWRFRGIRFAMSNSILAALLGIDLLIAGITLPGSFSPPPSGPTVWRPHILAGLGCADLTLVGSISLTAMLSIWTWRSYKVLRESDLIMGPKGVSRLEICFDVEDVEGCKRSVPASCREVHVDECQERILAAPASECDDHALSPRGTSTNQHEVQVERSHAASTAPGLRSESIEPVFSYWLAMQQGSPKPQV